MFCSGAGGVQRAIVLARGDRRSPTSTSPRDASSTEGWFAGAGMRASVSHRVVFDGAPVLAVLGAPGAIAQEPWFARDAVRTAATWAGAADAAADEAMRLLARPAEPTDLERLAAGRIRGRAGDDRAVARRAAGAEATPAPCGARTVAYLGTSSRPRRARLLDEAARACGSHPFTTGGGLDRARRDLELFTAPAPPRPHRRARRSGRAGGGAVSVDPATFERMYRDEQDPWGFGTSPTRRAKYDRTIAALGDRRFRRGLELGCSIGVLHRATGRALRRARRAGHVGDGRRAGARARRRRRDLRVATLPAGAARRAVRPRRRHEVLYYFARDVLDGLLDDLEAALEPGGRLLAVHWRPATRTYPLRGDEVHAILAARPALRGITRSPTTATGSTSWSGA